MLRSLRIENLVLIREAELAPAPGLNAITGETGAGKTILAQAFGLLLGAKGDAAAVGPGAAEAYVEAEFDAPPELLDDEELASLAELAPEDETGLVLARRVFADGRTRAYAWGRAVAREDLAAATERLLAMSGQFEQRRLARPSYQLDVLDSFCGEEQLRRRREARTAWRELAAARRRHDEVTRDAAAEEARLAELAALVEATAGLEPATEDELRAERERLRHVTELAEGAETAAEALAPDDGDGAAVLAARAERAIAPLERLAPELARAGDELRDLELRLREVGSELRGFLASLEAQPDRVEVVESELDRIAEAKRRFRAGSYEELLERAAAARARSSTRSPTGSTLRPPRQPRSRTRSSASRGSPTSFAPSGPRRATPSPRPSRPSSAASAWATASSASSSASAHRGRPVSTRSHSSSAPTPGCRSARSQRPPRGASSPGSRSRSPPSEEERRSSSTRSMRASAGRPPTPSRRR